MRFTLINTAHGTETVLDTHSYNIIITIGLEDTLGKIPNFSKDIIVTSSNSQTGYEVDTQREEAITQFITNFNNEF